MAVRNLAAIQRQGTMIAEVKKNAYEMKKNSVFNRVGLIRASQQDAIDAVDTIKALRENGLGARFDEWKDSHKQLVFTSTHGDGFRLSSNSYNVYYTPETNDVKFTWSGSGGCEGYSFNKYESDIRNMHYLIERVTKDDGYNKYDELLTKMAASFKPYLDEFFAWVDTI